MKAANMTYEKENCGISAELKAYVNQKLTTARQTLHTWRHRALTRRALSGLSTRLLEDAGIEPGQAEREADKHFWEA